MARALGLSRWFRLCGSSCPAALGFSTDCILPKSAPYTYNAYHNMDGVLSLASRGVSVPPVFHSEACHECALEKTGELSPARKKRYGSHLAQPLYFNNML